MIRNLYLYLLRRKGCPDRHVLRKEVDAAPGVGEEAAFLKFRILNLESPVLYWASLKVPHQFSNLFVDEMLPCVISSSDVSAGEREPVRLVYSRSG